ncbi:MAG: tetratricopeptide repeat protein [Halobacteriota archaeon]
MSSFGSVKKHKATTHLYKSTMRANRRVGWIYYQAYSLALSGKYLQSLTRFDEVLRLEPGYIHAWNQKGLCNYFLPRYNDAISCFDKASSLN